MKPFDLEAAKRGEPIVRDDGVPCKFIAFVPEAEMHEQLIISFNGSIHFYFKDGTNQSLRRLVMAPKKRTVWVNFYPNTTSAAVHETEERADHYAKGVRRIGGKAYPVEIEE